LRILHLGRFYQENAFGGTERHVAELLKALGTRIEADNLVAAASRHGDSFRVGDYQVHRAPSFGVIASTAVAPAMIAWARRLHAANPYDIVHLHFPDPLAQLVAQALPRSVRRVVSWHSDIVRQRLLLRLYRPWVDYFLRDVDAVIAATPAHYTSSRQLDAVPTERRHVIPYGLDYSRFDTPATLQRAHELRAGTGGRFPLIFAVGRHVYYKGFEYLINALKLLPSAQLVLGGSGPLTGHLHQVADAAGVADRVRFTGRLDDTELAAWYQACDIFCLPSIEPSEAFGLVQLEAMACGKPVVCSQLHNGVNAVCLDGITGLAAIPADPESLAGCLDRISTDEALRIRLGEAARRRARESFSAATMADQTLALYQQLL
jgi:rhamnosyl/mannosyltransferase